MRSRRGRKRKSGPRTKSGRLKRQPNPAYNPKLIAASQPHRRGLGENAHDQRGENELGRMALRGQLEDVLVLAGETYAAHWRAYVTTLNGPRWPWRSSGHGSCFGCEMICICRVRKLAYLSVEQAIAFMHPNLRQLIAKVTIYDQPCPVESIDLLRIGLNALAIYFGLTNPPKRRYSKNTSSRIMLN